MQRPSPQELIEFLGLEPLLPEGGMYRQTYRSAESIPQACLPERYQGDKPAGTAIYFLLDAERFPFSVLHRLPTDEIYHFYLGDPVEMLLLYPESGSERVALGQDILGGQRVQFVAPRGVWQGAYLLPESSFALMGTTMAPGFTEDDYEMPSRTGLLAAYPQEVELIRKLTLDRRDR